jgi:hypothetical protein
MNYEYNPFFRKKLKTYFFHSLSIAFRGNESASAILRIICHLYGVANIAAFDEGAFTAETPREQYMQRIRLSHNWADHVEIQIMAQVLKLRIIIIDGVHTTVVEPFDGETFTTIYLLYTNNNH